MMTSFSLKNFLIILLLIFVAFSLWALVRERPLEEISCTMEAKLCPDGSAVGRSGPKCEFAACPAVEIPSDWVATSSAGFSYRYPADFGTEYISPQDWPPVINRTTDPFVCATAGAENARAGETVERQIGNRHYCITTVTGAAAGSMYKQLAYATNRGGETIVLTFSTRQPQCGNYDEDKQLACERDQAAFSIDSIIDKIVSSID